MRATLVDLEVLARTGAPGGDDGEFAALRKSDPLFDRIARAIDGLETPNRTGTADLAALFRQWLVRAADGGPSPSIRLSRAVPWPEFATWHDYGCMSVFCDSATQLVSLREVAPVWLHGSAADAIGAACREEARRPGRSVPCDPVVAEMVPGTQDHYLSAGQQEAVRNAFLAAPGSTVLVCLPTGAGKTLAFQAPALAGIAEQQVTVVVVPTVALARDQERRFRELLSARKETEHLAGGIFAYHSGLTDVERKSLLQGLGDGTVPIVFTSPEAALGALRRPLLAAARAGRVRLFAVDEAHMVGQWGDSFRPHFQLVAGLRDALREEATDAGHPPFVTLLLTATLTEEAAYTLEQAFGRAGPLQIVAEPRLREEPAFLVQRAEDGPARDALLFEALRCLPKPLILYTTQPEEARRLEAALAERGHRRIRSVVGGDMAKAYGEEVLELWGRREIDIIVATSAFGLGVDQGDVRSVVHAWQPESLDRYYQEVGRSGRDGRASVALLLWTPGDAKLAESLATDLSISSDRGLERWAAMLHSSVDRQIKRTTTITVRTDARPSRVTEGSDLNTSWNLRTLVLMSRAGLIRFTCVPPVDPEQLAGETDEQFDARRRHAIDEAARTAAVEVLVDDVDELSTWQARVEPVRKSLYARDSKTIADVQRLLGGELVAPLFRDVYTVASLGIHPAPLGVEPTVVAPRVGVSRVTGALRSVLDGNVDAAGRLFVHYSEPATALARAAWREGELARVLERAALGGIVEFVIPQDLVGRKQWRAMSGQAPARFVCRVTGQESMTITRRPRLTILHGRTALELAPAALEADAAPHLILFPDHLPDPLHPYRRLRDSRTSMTLDALLGRLTQ